MLKRELIKCMWLKKAKNRKLNKNRKEYFPNNKKVYQS